MKKLIAVLMVVCLVFALAACSPSNTTITEEVKLDVKTANITTNSYSLQLTSGKSGYGTWGYWNDAYAYNTQATEVYKAFGISTSKVPEAIASADQRFQSLTTNGLFKLLNHPGTFVILFGGAWCPNTQALFPYLNAWAYANGIDTIYNYDFFLDGQFTNYDGTGNGSEINGKAIFNAAMAWGTSGLDQSVIDSLNLDNYGAKDTAYTTHLRSNYSYYLELYKQIMIRLTNYTTSNGELWMMDANANYIQIPKMSVPCVVVYDRDNETMTAQSQDVTLGNSSAIYHGKAMNGMYYTAVDSDGKVDLANSVPYLNLQTPRVQAALRAGTGAEGVLEADYCYNTSNYYSSYAATYIKDGDRMYKHALYPVMAKLEVCYSISATGGTMDPKSTGGVIQILGLKMLLNVMPKSFTVSYRADGTTENSRTQGTSYVAARFSYFQNASQMGNHVYPNNLAKAVTVNPAIEGYVKTMDVAPAFTDKVVDGVLKATTQHTTGLNMGTGTMSVGGTKIATAATYAADTKVGTEQYQAYAGEYIFALTASGTVDYERMIVSATDMTLATTLPIEVVSAGSTTYKLTAAAVTANTTYVLTNSGIRKATADDRFDATGYIIKVRADSRGTTRLSSYDTATWKEIEIKVPLYRDAFSSAGLMYKAPGTDVTVRFETTAGTNYGKTFDYAVVKNTDGTMDQANYYWVTAEAALTTKNVLFGQALSFLGDGDQVGSTVTNNAGVHLKSVTYQELMYLANQPGDWIVLFGGEWCPYTAAAGSVLNWVVNNNVAATNTGTNSNFSNLTVYVMDLRIDGATSSMMYRNSTTLVSTAAQIVDYVAMSAVVLQQVGNMQYWQPKTSLTANGTGANAGKIVATNAATGNTDVYSVPASSDYGAIITNYKVRQTNVRTVQLGNNGIVYGDNYTGISYVTPPATFVNNKGATTKLTLTTCVVLDADTFTPSIVPGKSTARYAQIWKSGTSAEGLVQYNATTGKVEGVLVGGVLNTKVGIVDPANIKFATASSSKAFTYNKDNVDDPVKMYNFSSFVYATSATNYFQDTAQKVDARFTKLYIVILYYFNNYVDGYFANDTGCTILAKSRMKIGAPSIILYNKDATNAAGVSTPCVTWVGVDHDWAGWAVPWSEVMMGAEIAADNFYAWDYMNRITTQINTFVVRSGQTVVTTAKLTSSSTTTEVVTSVTKA